MSVSTKSVYDVIIAPVVSEKSYGQIDEDKYTFEVAPDSNKLEIKQAIETIWDVKVASINTMNRKGKRKRTRFGWGSRNEGKKYLTWVFVSISRRPRVAAVRALLISLKSPAPPRKSPCFVRFTRPAAVTTPAASPPVTRVAATSASTV